MSRPEFREIMSGLEHCVFCPRLCGVNRINGRLGACKGDASFDVASVSIHHGEEPAICGEHGICNIFYRHCNLRCQFCQNYQISQAQNPKNYEIKQNLDELLGKIEEIISKGIQRVGFVSPTHFIPQTRVLIKALKATHPELYFVYNTNAYDLPSSLRLLEGDIDIYLPDFKYSDSELAYKLSGIKNYPENALNAIKEMKRQKGLQLHCTDMGEAVSGIIVRHLVLPGQVKNSLEVLEIIAREIGTTIHLSLMAQYHPLRNIEGFPELSRGLYAEEYQQVRERMENLGFENGWVQELESSDHYLPDFTKDNPFG